MAQEVKKHGSAVLIPRPRFFASPWHATETGKEAAIGTYAHLWLGWMGGIMVGVGYDADHPLRPWPWATRKRTPGGRQAVCVTLFGLFVNVCLVRPAPARGGA